MKSGDLTGGNLFDLATVDPDIAELTIGQALKLADGGEMHDAIMDMAVKAAEKDSDGNSRALTDRMAGTVRHD
nr:hypothetical protein [Nordella sp. HKS 07]